MLRFSKKVEYALIAMTDMSEFTTPDRLVTAKALAAHYLIPQDILGKVLQTLVREGLLVSVQGVKGGYALAQSPECIKIKNIIEAIDGAIVLVQCYNHFEPCGQFEHCNIKMPMQVIQEELAGFFNKISLADLKTDKTGAPKETAFSRPRVLTEPP